MRCAVKKLCVLGLALLPALSLSAQTRVLIQDVPDYDWFAGCFGTACGNLMGFWDRNGLPDYYTGPTGGGLAPLNDWGSNRGIRSLWATQAGLDGRPSNKPGHVDDYWAYYDCDWNGCFSYESTKSDPYVLAGRQEHAPDCIGDFIGLSQKRWTNMNGECDGNLDAYSFVYWDTRGTRRTNYTPPATAGTPARDLQSGLREWARWRGYDADVFTQLVSFNPSVPAGRGFSFTDLKTEINAGYPVLLFLQDYNQMYRPFTGPPAMSRGNPDIHGMLAIGYEEWPGIGLQQVYFRNSWATSDPIYKPWNADQAWLPYPSEGLYLNLRGVIGYHPKPKIRRTERQGSSITLHWDGPSAQVVTEQLDENGNPVGSSGKTVHSYIVERSTTLATGSWSAVTQSTTNRSVTLQDCCGGHAFYRVKLVPTN